MLLLLIIKTRFGIGGNTFKELVLIAVSHLRKNKTHYDQVIIFVNFTTSCSLNGLAVQLMDRPYQPI